MICKQCGAAAEGNLGFCKYCGSKLEGIISDVKENNQYSQKEKDVNVNVKYEAPAGKKVPVKSKAVAGILGILLGGFGIHKFYLGKPIQGFLYLIFCWAWIPSIIGFIEGISYLTKSDEDWANKVGYTIQ